MAAADAGLIRTRRAGLGRRSGPPASRPQLSLGLDVPPRPRLGGSPDAPTSAVSSDRTARRIAVRVIQFRRDIVFIRVCQTAHHPILNGYSRS